MRVLVVEDEAALRDTLKTRLHGGRLHGRCGAATARRACSRRSSIPLDVAIIDLGLPKLPGLEVIRRLRAARKSYPDPDPHRARQLAGQGRRAAGRRRRLRRQAVSLRGGAGALQALLRRAGGWASPELGCGPIALDTRAQTVKVDGAPVELTTFEYRILEHLMLRAGEVISKTELTERLYDQDFERDSNVIEVLVGRLRRKLDPQDQLQPDRDAARPRLPLRARARPGAA